MSNSFDAVSRFGSVPGAGFTGKGGSASSGAWLQELERAALDNRPQAAAGEVQRPRAPAGQPEGGRAGADPGARQAHQDAARGARHEREGQGAVAEAGAGAAGAAARARVEEGSGAPNPAVSAAAPAAAAPARQGAPVPSATVELAHVGLLTMELAASGAATQRAAAPAPLAPPSAAPAAMPGAPMMAIAAAAALPAPTADGMRPAAAGAPTPPLRAGARPASAREQAPAGEQAGEQAPASGGASAAEELPYALRSMHLFRDGDGVQAWIRDAALSQFQANALAHSLKKEMQAEGLTLQALTLNGKKTSVANVAAAPPAPLKRK